MACGGSSSGGASSGAAEASTAAAEASTAAAETSAAAEASTAAEVAPAADGTVQVGIVLPTMDEPRWLQDQAQFEKLLGDAGFTSEVMFSGGDVATERANVDSLVTKGAQVIIICAHDGAAAGAAVADAKADGVTIIAYDRLITDTDAVDYYVTFDSVSVGEAQAQYLVDHAPEGTGIPLYLYAGAASDNNAFLFFEGAWNVLQPKIADGTYVVQNSDKAVELMNNATLTREEMSSIIEQITTNWNFDDASRLANANLTAGGAQKGDVLVLAPNDGTARAIADAFADDADVSSYVISGQDAEKASVQYIIDGMQSMTVFKDTRTLAKDSVDMAVAILNGQTPETGATYNNGAIDVPSKQTDVVAVDAENVKAALIDSGYYEASDFTGLE
ncbi:MAG: sugar-binding protein [Lachnospiraceae bacterium]|nr:sugar-binding protein [Lachnospiraceae bacterium]MBQ6903320.1 sugar-binding protein [Lachnospiraceae bacterium]